VEVPARELPELESGRYYHFQLVGLQVFAADGRGIGVVREVLGTGGNDVLSVRDGDREILIPLIEDAVARVDLPAGRLVLKDLEGLLQP
jgi:16S rRNA processing protein RimM